MDNDARLQAADKLLAPWTVSSSRPEPNRLDVTLSGGDLLSAVKELNSQRWGFLSAVTGLDLGTSAGELQVLYHFCSGATVLTLRVPTPRTSPSVPSVSGLIPSAVLFERELLEMFGVDVVGLANRDHLFLPEDWKENTFPLRKDAQL